MKSILQSIKPQYCELIASGKKTIEVRKTRPKLDVPFKVYIYCMKDKLLTKSHNNGNIYLSENKYKTALEKAGNVTLSGKVIGEYVCDEIFSFGFTPYNHGEYMLSGNADSERDVLKDSCLSFSEMYEYIGEGYGYAWHISDLKIYDKPKELYDFIKPCTDPYQYCQGCEHGHINYPCDVETYEDLSGCCFDTVCLNRIRKAPQSWCYVEEG